MRNYVQACPKVYGSVTCAYQPASLSTMYVIAFVRDAGRTIRLDSHLLQHDPAYSILEVRYVYTVAWDRPVLLRYA